MIETAGVQPDAPDRRRPRSSSVRFISQRPAPVPTNLAVTPNMPISHCPGCENRVQANLRRLRPRPAHRSRSMANGSSRPVRRPASAAAKTTAIVRRCGDRDRETSRDRASPPGAASITRGIVRQRRALGHFQMRDDGRDLAGGDIGIAVGQMHAALTPLITRQHPLHRPRPARQLPLPRRRTHRRLEAAFQPPVVGKFCGLGIDAGRKPREIGGAECGGFLDHRAIDRRVQQIGEALHGPVRRRHAAVDAQHGVAALASGQSARIAAQRSQVW